MTNSHLATQQTQTKLFSAVLGILSILSILVMFHHPSVSADDIQLQIKEINDEAKLNTWVHGVLIAFVMLINICLTYYSKLRGFHNTSVLMATVIYWVASAVMILAALLSGIIGPQLAELYQSASSNEAVVFRGVFSMKSLMNQAYANFAVFCWAAAIALWSVDMLRFSAMAKWIGVMSLAAAVMIALSLLIGWVSLNVFGMTVILVVISAWQLAVAGLMWFSQQISA